MRKTELTESLFQENEKQANVLACKIIIGYALFLCMLLVMDLLVLDYFSTDAWRNLFFMFSMALFGSALIAKINHYEKKWIKYMLAASITVCSAAMHFYAGVFTLFFIVCPTVISTTYYNQKFVCEVGAFTCLLLTLSDSMNYILEMTTPSIQALHASQGIVLWKSIHDILLYESIPRFSVLLLNVFLCTMIAQRGKKLVLLQAQTTQEKTAMASELKAASSIQNSLLPPSSYVSPQSEILLEAHLVPAKEASGDFYDYFMVDSHRLAFLIADVSDKGLAAAMFMMSARNALRISLMQNNDICEAVILANKALAKDNVSCMFVTVWIGMIDIHTGAGYYVNLGHPDPILIRRDKTVKILNTEPDNFLGVFDNLNPQKHFFRLEEGDDLLLYTDGLTDANNASKEMFGEERLREAVQESTRFAEIVPGESDSAEQTEIRSALDYVMKQIEEFSPQANHFDDQTALALRMNKVTNQAEKTSFIVACRPGAGAEICTKINEKLQNVSCPDDARRLIDTAISEIADNITEYSQATDDIHIGLQLADNYITMEFADNGIPFDPLAKENPSTDGNPLYGGYGIFIVKSIASDLKYERKDGRNILTFTKLWICAD